MKKNLFTLAAALLVFTSAFSQNTNPWPSTGSVGIGTTSPLSLLHVNSEITAGVNNNGYGRMVIEKNLNQPNGYRYLLLVKQKAGGSVAGTLTGKRQDNSDFGHNSASFYVNIRSNDDTNAPSLVYWEADAAGPSLGSGSSTNVKLVTLTYGGEIWYAIDAVFDDATHRTFGLSSFTGNVGLAAFTWITEASASNVENANSTSLKNWGGRMMIATNGNVGIGTTNTEGYKFAVNGSAIATSMKVKLFAYWPDFVFKKDYKLPTLTELKKYIDKNQHLPEIPTADEVHTNGLDLGEMDRLLVKKIEELTLYLIQKDEQLKDQQKINRLHQEQIEQLKVQIDNINKGLQGK